jgi:hypothetical protein
MWKIIIAQGHQILFWKAKTLTTKILNTIFEKDEGVMIFLFTHNHFANGNGFNSPLGFGYYNQCWPDIEN